MRELIFPVGCLNRSLGSLPRILLLILVLCSLLLLAYPLQAQAPRDALTQAIQERAQKDVDLEKPMEGAAGLDVLFREEAASVGMPMAEVLRIYEDAYTAAKPPEPWWSPFQPVLTWAGIAALLVLIFQNLLKDSITKFFKSLGKLVYRRVAGYKPFWWIALRHYRRALVKRYKELKIAFRPGRPLLMQEVYVPLKAAKTADPEVIDAHRAIAEHRCLMVIGAPGAGKSMLLRHIALTYAQGEQAHFPTQPIPILLELNRLNDSEVPLHEHLVKVLEQNGFPRADSFLEAGLEHGLLLLLFDGLDEVTRAVRERVVNQVKDLLNEFPDCRTVITCRTAVYHDEFADWADQELEIVEFNDQQIQSFLGSWQQDMPSGKSVEHLLRNLRERPRIIALARNPLLLTIIAYLYSDTAFVLPHSRAEFYKVSVTVLLEQWKEKRNRYKASQKRLVLQRLALSNQDSSSRRRQDRRSIDLPTVLAEITGVLPSLTLKDEDAQPILDEIVERSGLLIALDGGLRYQFTHLTLQEFFAALALESDAKALIRLYMAEPDAWRETARLWCGLEHNSTPLIRQLYTFDAVMAFECLADAQQIDSDFAEEVITAFKSRLGADDEAGDAVTRAFAIVATDPRGRGQQVFRFLASTLASADASSERRLAAAGALALTNLPHAAQMLAQCAPNQPEVRPFLTQMGNLAVPPLATLAGEGLTWTFVALQAIGTPQAALELVPLLWSANAPLQYQAAWRLAALLVTPNVETALNDYPLTAEQRSANQLEWIWEPFADDPESTMRVIAGRIAHLLHTAPAAYIPNDPSPSLDLRLVIPLCIIEAQKDKRVRLDIATLRKLWADTDQLRDHLRIPSAAQPAQDSSAQERFAQDRFVTAALNEISDHLGWHFLFRSLPAPLQFELLLRLIRTVRTTTRSDWRNIYHPVQYDFARSWHSLGIRLALAVVCVLNLCVLARTIIEAPQLMSWENFLLAIVGLSLLGALLFLAFRPLGLDILEMVVFFVQVGLGPALVAALSASHSDILIVSIGAVIGVAIVSAARPVLERLSNSPDNLTGREMLGGVIGGLVANAIPYFSTSSILIMLYGVAAGVTAAVLFCAAFLIVLKLAFRRSRRVKAFYFLGAFIGVIAGAAGVAFAVPLGGAIGGLTLCAVAWFVLEVRHPSDWPGDFLINVLVVAAFALTAAPLLYLPTDFLLSIWDPIPVVSFCLVLIVSYGVLWRLGAWRQREAQNPLKGILDQNMPAIVWKHKLGIRGLDPPWS